jgi:hypothetical protein
MSSSRDEGSGSGSLTFSSDCRTAILMAPDNRVSIFSTTSTASAPIRFAEKAHLSAGYCTTPAWLVSSSSSSNSSSNSIASHKDLFAIGTSTGTVVVWDSKRAEVALRLANNAHTAVAVQSTTSGGSSKGAGLAASSAVRGSAMQALTWSAVSEKLYACQENSGSVLEWNFSSYLSSIRSLNSSSATPPPVAPRVIQIDKRGITRMAITSDGETLFAAGGGGGDSIFMVDIASGIRGKRLQGHSLPITGLIVSEDSQLVVSCSDERNLHLWDLKEKTVKAALSASANQSTSPIASAAKSSKGSSNNKDATTSNSNSTAAVPPSAVLLHTGRPLPDSISVLRCKSGLYHIAALSEDGTALIWRYKRASTKGNEEEAESNPQGGSTSSSSSAAAAPILPSCVIRAEHAVSATALNAEAPFIAAISLKLTTEQQQQSGGGVVVAHVAAGPLAAPSFYEAKYTENDGKSLNLSSSVVVSVFQSQSHRQEAISAASKKNSRSKKDEDEEMDGDDNNHLENEDEDAIIDKRAVDTHSSSSSTTTTGLRSSNSVAGVSATVMKVARDVNNTNETIAEARVATAAARRSLRDGTDASGSTTAIVGEKRRREAEGDSAADVDDENDEANTGASLGERLRAIVAALRDPNSADIGSDLIAASSSSQAAYNGGSAAGAASKNSGGASTVAEAILSPTGSLATILTQALQAKDDAQLELVLSNSNEKGVVQATVARLPPQLVLPFITRLVSRLQAKPSRAQQLLSWVRAVLVQHTGFLLSQPALVANLEALYTVIDSRVAVYKKLLKLSGRLDLLMSQLPSEHHQQLQGRSGGGPSRISAKALRRAKLTVEQTALEEKIVAKRRIEELKEEEDEDDEGEEDEEEDEIDEDIDEEDEDEDED